jgi:hypothetical protein
MSGEEETVQKQYAQTRSRRGQILRALPPEHEGKLPGDQKIKSTLVRKSASSRCWVTQEPVIIKQVEQPCKIETKLLSPWVLGGIGNRSVFFHQARQGTRFLCKLLLKEFTSPCIIGHYSSPPSEIFKRILASIDAGDIYYINFQSFWDGFPSIYRHRLSRIPADDPQSRSDSYALLRFAEAILTMMVIQDA